MIGLVVALSESECGGRCRAGADALGAVVERVGEFSEPLERELGSPDRGSPEGGVSDTAGSTTTAPLVGPTRLARCLRAARRAQAAGVGRMDMMLGFTTRAGTSCMATHLRETSRRRGAVVPDARA